MLAGLDDVSWENLSHALGKAENIPGLLRDLRSEHEGRRAHAHEDLFQTIWHQGTVYEATSYAVPFLLELLSDPVLPDRTTVTLLFASIAAGTGYLRVHAARPELEAQWRKILAKRGTTFEAELDREARIVAAVREQSARGIHLLLPHIDSDVADLRIAVAEALPLYPTWAEQSTAALRRALDREMDPEVRSVLETSFRSLSAKSPA